MQSSMSRRGLAWFSMGGGGVIGTGRGKVGVTGSRVGWADARRRVAGEGSVGGCKGCSNLPWLPTFSCITHVYPCIRVPGVVQGGRGIHEICKRTKYPSPTPSSALGSISHTVSNGKHITKSFQHTGPWIVSHTKFSSDTVTSLIFLVNVCLSVYVERQYPRGKVPSWFLWGFFSPARGGGGGSLRHPASYREVTGP